ncbi:MAG: hypothetical protein WEF50_12915 [Myxococcota bacterium]
MRAGARRALPAIRRELEGRRFLLIADAHLPSIAAIVAREPISGSWWSHPLAHEIYDVCQWLEDQPEAARVKLISGKVTFVHRSLFASVAAVGSACKLWQMRALAPAAKRLLARCDARGVIRLDELTPRTRDAAQARAKAALELERRLLVRRSVASCSSPPWPSSAPRPVAARCCPGSELPPCGATRSGFY